MILKVVYDMEIDDIKDDYVRLAQEAVYGLSVTFVPGKFWAEYFTILQYLPTWLPGTSFRKATDYYRPIVEEMRNRPYDKIQADMVSCCLTTGVCVG